ncbi:DUF3212 family protein, partial [Bacillus atrophaeus]
YLSALLPFVSADMLAASQANANEFLSNKHDTNAYHLFLPDDAFIRKQ